jgi:hypothetical protein
VPVLQNPPSQQGWPDSPQAVQVSEPQARPLAQNPYEPPQQCSPVSPQGTHSELYDTE